MDNIDGIVLSDTKKIENKIRHNFGREFYEQGCWGTLTEFKKALQESRNFSYLPAQTPQHIDLITGVLEAYEETIALLESIELLIRTEFKKSASPPGLYPFFSKPYPACSQVSSELESAHSSL